MIVVAVAKPQIPPKTGSFTVNLRTGSMPAAYINSEYMTWLNDMKRFYERVITSNWTLDITVKFVDEGANNTLGHCGPGNGGWQTPKDMADIVGDLRTDMTPGNMKATVKHCTMVFNTYYYKEPPVTERDRGWKRQFFTTALHECLHGLGLGSLWNGDFRVALHIPNPFGSGGINIPLADPTLASWGLAPFAYNMIGTGDPNNPRYTATYARTEYRNEMVGQSGVGSIPIENFDGKKVLPWNTTMAAAGGTALAHWRGSYDDIPSGIVNAKGQDSIDEVFTSWSSRDEGRRRWMGRYTIGALRDIGYSVSYTPLQVALLDWKSA